MSSFAGDHARLGSAGPLDAPLDVAGAEHFGTYVDGACETHHTTYAGALDRVRGLGRGFVWISLDDPDEHQIRSLALLFDLHPLAVEHALKHQGAPKVEWYDHFLMVTMRTFGHTGYRPDQGALTDGRIALFLGHDFLITCGRGEHSALAEIRSRVETSPALEPSAVMHAIADRIVGGYLALAGVLRAEADLVEEKVFSQSCDGDIERIYFLRREIVHVRRSIEPLTHALRQFQVEHGDLISTELSHSMRDVMGQNIHAIERIATTEALLESLLETAFGREGTKQNVDMRKISAWAAMAAVPTTVAGIYGMRFPNMPELHWEWGYPAVLTAMVLVMAVLYRTFHRKRWL
jgi:magnesium transporter